MPIRKLFFSWQFVAAFALPIWLFVGWAIFGGRGIDFVALLIGGPLLTIGMLVVAAVTFFRKSVRTSRVVSWLDIVVVGVWQAVIIALGFFTVASSWLAVFTVLIGLAALWSAVWQLVSETRRRINTVLGSLDAEAQRRAGRSTSAPLDGGDMIVIDEKRGRD